MIFGRRSKRTFTRMTYTIFVCFMFYCLEMSLKSETESPKYLVQDKEDDTPVTSQTDIYTVRRVTDRTGVVFHPGSPNNSLHLFHHYPTDVDLKDLVTHVQQGHDIDVATVNEDVFNFIQQPSICPVNKPIFMIYLIKTRPTAFARRQAIRDTWGNETLIPGVTIKRIFIIGMPSDKKTQEQILREHEDQIDLLQGDFLDSYDQTRLKMVMGFRWVVTFCSQSKFVVCADDDVILNPRNVINTLSLTKIGQIEKLYMGWFDGIYKPFRENITTKKQIVSPDMYPFNEYPPIAPAGNYYVNMKFAREFDIAAKYVKALAHDDVYLGIVARKLQVPLVNTNLIVFPSRKKNLRSWILKCHDCLSFCFEFSTKNMRHLWKRIFRNNHINDVIDSGDSRSYFAFNISRSI